jgi:hypothetical protein
VSDQLDEDFLREVGGYTAAEIAAMPSRAGTVIVPTEERKAYYARQYPDAEPAA